MCPLKSRDAERSRTHRSRGLRQFQKQFVSLRTERGLNIISSEDDYRLILPKMRQDAVLGILLIHDREQSIDFAAGENGEAFERIMAVENASV